jgi:alpha-L-arabinofuranosidase
MGRLSRRKFLTSTLMGTAGLLASRQSKAADSRIEILIDEPIGLISPYLYGHFTEHIGGVIYDGIWVGEDSKIPNVDGIRKALVEQMRKLRTSVVRWPGGCFADSYNWRDGIGPRSQRPRRTNFWIDDPFMLRAPDGPWKYDPNQFGTHEFMHFCRLIGAQPYLAANVRSLKPEDFYQWVEYCNAPAGATSLSDLRGTNGDRDPFGVRFWGIGNESWGCGGNFTAEEYAVEYRKFVAWAPRFGLNPAFIASGPDSGDTEWTRRFFERLLAKGRDQLRTLYGWALHYYCGTVGRGQAVDFTLEDWYELLAKANRMESLIAQHWSIMSEMDPGHEVKLIVDEWGAWHLAGSEVDSSHLFGQTSTLRDGLIAALTLDTFNRHADKIAMANVAQLINNLHSLFLAHEDRFIVTPNFHVFEMYSAHHGGQSVRTLFSAPPSGYNEPGKVIWGLAGSTSLHDKELVLTTVNPHASQHREAEIMVRGATPRSCKAKILSSSDIHAQNSFANPHALEPKSAEVPIQGQPLIYSFAPASVTRLRLTLG